MLPVGVDGAINGYTKHMSDMKLEHGTERNIDVQLVENEGHRLFIEDRTDSVFVLTKNHS